MSDAIEFETPENVTVHYTLAGPGTRFVAWIFDMLIIFVANLFILLAMLVFFISTRGTMGPEDPVVIFAVVAILGFFVLAYFLVFEFAMHGQTPGKRQEGIRVVSESGFSLTFTALFIRNIFRILDTTPILWIVPLVSQRSQRFGDMVAGTVVIQEHKSNPDSAQDRLLSRSIDESRFEFTHSQISQLTDNDVKAIEMFLNRSTRMKAQQEATIRTKLITTLSERVHVPFEGRGIQAERQYIEDMFAAHLRYQVRELE